jgi:hypothetical protein
MTYKMTPRHFLPVSILCIVAGFAGCKKSGDGAADGQNDNSTVVLNSADMANDGTIKPAGLKKIEQLSSAPSITVTFSRTTVSDPVLTQLAKFPNLRHVKAPGGRFQPEAIEKLKAKIPDVDVTK